MIVGLTGGIGSGKTTVAILFEKLGVPIYVADVEAKKLMNEFLPLMECIKKVFGKEAYVDGVLNSAYLASIVFKDKEKLQLLNQLVHPEVKKHFLKFYQLQTASYVVYESAILLEKVGVVVPDKVIVVIADEQTRIERVVKRDCQSKENILARIKHQWTDIQRVEKADFIIDNNGLIDLESQVLAIHTQLKLLVK